MRKPTKDTIAITIELPTLLVERLRDFARRDQRSLKTEFVRALDLLLSTYDTPALAPPTVVESGPQTMRESRDRRNCQVLNKKNLLKLNKTLEKLGAEAGLATNVLLLLRMGLSDEEIHEELPQERTKALVKMIEKLAQKLLETQTQSEVQR